MDDDHPGFGAAIGDVRRHWPVVPTSAAGGARNDHSTWLHLIVCHLERRATQQLVGQDHEALLLDFQVSARPVYPWIRGEVVEHERWLDQTPTARELWPDWLGGCDLDDAARR